MKEPLRILMLEDTSSDVDLIQRELQKGGIHFTSLVVTRKDEFEKALRSFNPDVILSDHSLPHFNSIEALRSYKEYQKETMGLVPFILVTGVVSEDFAVQCFKAGVDDYIMKDRLKRLPLSIESALEKCRIERERREYFAQVMAKEALMNAAEHLAGFASWEVDLVTGKHTWSDGTYHLYGYTPQDVEPSYDLFLKRVHPDDVLSLENARAHALLNLTSVENEFRMIDNKGNLKYISAKMEIHRNGEGQPVRLLGFNLDITEKKKAQIQFLESQQEYKSLFDQNPDGVFSLDLQGKFTKVNKGLTHLAGLSESALQGKDFLSFIPESDLARVRNHHLSTVAGMPQRYEVELFSRQGKKLTMDVTTMPVVVNDNIIGIHGVAKDITDKREMESFLDQVNRLACIGGWEVDLIRRSVSWTSITRELHEVEDDYVPDIESGILFYKEGRNRETIREALMNAIKNGTAWDLELEIITAKGNARWIRTIGEATMSNR